MSDDELIEYLKLSKFTIIGCVKNKEQLLYNLLDNTNSEIIDISDSHRILSFIKRTANINYLMDDNKGSVCYIIDISSICFAPQVSTSVSFVEKLTNISNEHEIRFIIVVTVYTSSTLGFSVKKEIERESDLIILYDDNATILKSKIWKQKMK